MSLKIAVKKIASVRVASLREVVANYQSQGLLWARTMEFAYTNRLVPPPAQANASFAIFHDKGFKQTDVDTEVCVPIDETATANDATGVKVYEVPEIPRAASVTHKGPYKGLVDVYGQLFGWIAMQGETINGPVREIYHVGAMNHPDLDEDELVTEIVVPLK